MHEQPNQSSSHREAPYKTTDDDSTGSTTETTSGNSPDTEDNTRSADSTGHCISTLTSCSTSTKTTGGFFNHAPTQRKPAISQHQPHLHEHQN